MMLVFITIGSLLLYTEYTNNKRIKNFKNNRIRIQLNNRIHIIHINDAMCII